MKLRLNRLNLALATALTLFSAQTMAEPKDGASTFTGTVSCELACRGQDSTPQVRSVVARYDAVARGLRRGNGNFWGSLSKDLNLWSGSLCLDEAVHECGSLADVETFRVTEIRSGAWHLKGALTCEPPPAIIPSPFDAAVVPFVDKGQADIITTDYRTAAYGKVITKDDDACAVRIKGKICYGDCMVSRETWAADLGSAFDLDTLKLKHAISRQGGVETLATPASFTSNEVEVCAEDFVSGFLGQELSRPVLQFYCEQYFWNSLAEVRQYRLAGSCAALRGSIDCQTALDDLKSFGIAPASP